MTKEIENLCITFKNNLKKIGVKNSKLLVEIKDVKYQKADSPYNVKISLNLEKPTEKVEFMAINSDDKILYSYLTDL
jgi:hypothetical protein